MSDEERAATLLAGEELRRDVLLLKGTARDAIARAHAVVRAPRDRSIVQPVPQAIAHRARR